MTFKQKIVDLFAPIIDCLPEGFRKHSQKTSMQFDVAAARRKQKILAKKMKNCTPEEFNNYNAQYYSLEEGITAVWYMERLELQNDNQFPTLFNGYKDKDGKTVRPNIFVDKTNSI